MATPIPDIPNSANLVRAIAAPTGAVTNQVLVTGQAGKQLYVTEISAFVSNTALAVNLLFNTVSIATLAQHPGLPANSGFTESGGFTVLFVLPLGESLRFTCSTPSTGTLVVAASGFFA